MLTSWPVPRLEYPGGLYHVTSRGNGRSKIFRSSKDRTPFLTILAAVIQNYNWQLHAYCLMDNHYHLVVETPDGNLSRGMRQFNGVYTQTSMHAIWGQTLTLLLTPSESTL
jgi:putative transposase